MIPLLHYCPSMTEKGIGKKFRVPYCYVSYRCEQHYIRILPLLEHTPKLIASWKKMIYFLTILWLQASNCLDSQWGLMVNDI